jgi:RNA recognition motif-containing protein
MPKPTYSNPDARVYVGNLSYETTFADLDKMFGVYGPIRDKYMPRSDRDKSLNKGFAFVEFINPEDAKAAVDDDRGWKGPNGWPVTVKIADTRSAS